MEPSAGSYREEIVDLPLNGRNFTQLLLLNSGAVSSSGEQGLFAGKRRRLAHDPGFASNLQPVLSRWHQYQRHLLPTPAVVPSIDILQEFQEQTKGYSAAYGGGCEPAEYEHPVRVKSGPRHSLRLFPQRRS